MNVLRLLTTAALGVSAVCVAPADAHPISMSESVIDVRPDRIDVELTIFVEDLALYYPVAAGANDRFPAGPLREAAKTHPKFLLDGLILRDEQGTRLRGDVDSIDVSKIPDEGVTQTELKERSVVYRLRYKLERQPRFVTVTQQFGGAKAILPAIMDCTVLQSGVLLDTSEPLLSGQTHTAKLDWDNPPKPVRNWRELRERRRKELRQRLGIASYSGLYSFIYITPHEVRHEVLIPLLTLEQWLPIQRENQDFLEIDEQQAARSRIEEFFSGRNPVTINGKAVRPKLTRLSFFGLDIRDFALNAKARRVSVHQARVGVILSYLPHDTPRSSEFRWDLFSRHAPFLRSIVYEFDQPAVEHYFRPDEDTFTWSATTQPDRPVIATVATSGGNKAPTTAQARLITGSLLKNVYRAFGLRDEEATYDALASGVDGPLLRTLYLQFRRSLLMSEQGGARSRVDTIRRISSRLIESAADSFQVEHCWRLTGTVEHWGHIHTRENEYTARIVVTAVDGHWKISRVSFTDQKRVRFQTELRGLSSGL
jgi:hypothetical protein